MGSRSSDRRIVAAEKIEADPSPARKTQERRDARDPGDTWPAPPPSSASAIDEVDSRDTIPTPPPESGTSDVVVVPPLHELRLDDEALDEEIA